MIKYVCFLILRTNFKCNVPKSVQEDIAERAVRLLTLNEAGIEVYVDIARNVRQIDDIESPSVFPELIRKGQLRYDIAL